MMIAGYSERPDDFPSADIAALQAAQDEYQTATEVLTGAQSAAKQAAKIKTQKLEQLLAITKAQLKKSQVDTADCPQKLGFIGWGPKAESKPMQPPSQPTNLKIIAQGITGSENNRMGLLQLNWKKSAFKRARFVRFYSVERRQIQSNGNGEAAISPWIKIASAINNEIILKTEPLGVRMEYRVRAVNKGGQSCPSNTIVVIL
jgi:hypothetical protein